MINFRKQKNSNLSGKKPGYIPAPIPIEDIEQVLEHVTSPYRWEILDVPVAAEPGKPGRRSLKKQ
jgi:hypothetical protein